MPDGNVEVKAIFEEDTPPMPTDPAKPGISVTGTYTYNGSEHTAAAVSYTHLSGTGIRGTANDKLSDKTLHYVPFTYAGTVDAYKLTSAMATTAAYAQQNKYSHSLFVADFAVTHTASWNRLNAAGLIFGKAYTSGGVEYTLRVPSMGSSGVGSGYSQHGIPVSYTHLPGK